MAIHIGFCDYKRIKREKYHTHLINLEKIKLLVLRGNEELDVQPKHEQWFDQIKASGGRVII